MTPMWRYHSPVDVHFGAGALRELPRVAAARKAVLVTFPEAVQLGLVARVQQLLGDTLVPTRYPMRWRSTRRAPYSPSFRG